MSSPIGERLVAARKLSGITLQQLADKLEMSITKQALNKYERGTARPSGETLVKIAAVFGVPVDYFYREQSVTLGPIDFRKQSHLKALEIERIKAECSDFLERYAELENLLNKKTSFENPLQPAQRKIKSDSDIEKATTHIRSIWQLGSSPIPSVISMLEDNHIRVFETHAPDSFVGMSTWIDKMPVIVLNKNINTQRKRFTALHELAHLLLNLEGKEDKEIETICHSFAGSFLLPKDQFEQKFGSRRTGYSIEELIMIDENYGISVQAVMARAHHLKIISESTFREFQNWLIKSGNKKKELGAYNINDRPQRFDRLLYSAVSENIITQSKATALSNRKAGDFQ